MIAIKKKLFKGAMFTALSFIALILPNMVLFVVKRNEYFVHGADKISMGAMILLVFSLFMVKGALKDLDKRTTVLISLSIMLVTVWCFDSIIADLFWIILSSIIGYVLYLVLNIIGKRDLVYYKDYRSESARVMARKDAAEAVDVGGSV